MPALYPQVSFVLKIDSQGDFIVDKVSCDLFGNVLEPMGWFPSYNRHKAESFLDYLKSNPNSNITEFFNSVSDEG